MNNFKKYLVNKFPQLGKWIKYKFDIIWEDSEKDHELGGIYDYDDKDLIEDGDWLKPLNKILTEREFFEIQKGRFLETLGCTGYGTLNAIELMSYFKWLMIWNKADRYTNKLSGTTKNGNSVTRVFESIRKLHGVVDEKDYPWNRDTFRWSEYYKTVPSSIINIGKAWTKQYAFNYQKIGIDHYSIKAGLKKSPVGVGGYAWYKKGDKYYSVGNSNHWFIIIKQNWGENYIILDSYAPYIKTLDWNFKFSFARTFFLNKKELVYNKSEIETLKNNGYEYVIRGDKDGMFYEIKDNKLVYEKDLTKIAERIAEKFKDSPQAVENILKFLTQQGKVKWVDETYYNNKLLK